MEHGGYGLPRFGRNVKSLTYGCWVFWCNKTPDYINVVFEVVNYAKTASFCTGFSQKHHLILLNDKILIKSSKNPYFIIDLD